MVLLRRKTIKVNEDNNQDTAVTITDHELIQLQALAQKKKADAKKQYDAACQEYENVVAQLMSKQAEINKQKAAQQQNNVPFNTQESVNEGVNTKHIIIGEIISKNLKNRDYSYILSDTEITRIARKINDYFNAHKSDFDIDAFKLNIKNYFLNHSKINFSRKETSDFVDDLILELSSNDYKQFNDFFKNIEKEEYVIQLDDIDDVDEFENDLTDNGFDFDEDLEENTLIIKNKSKF